jgi:hypothetical protein
MSAVSTSDVTGPLDAAHRTDAPVWAFHLALAWTVWGISTAVLRVNAWEQRILTRYPLTAAFAALAGVTIVFAAIIALVVNA